MAQPSASWLSGGLSQRQTSGQSAAWPIRAHHARAFLTTHLPSPHLTSPNLTSPHLATVRAIFQRHAQLGLYDLVSFVGRQNRPHLQLGLR